MSTDPTTDDAARRSPGPAWNAFTEASARAHRLRLALADAEAEVEGLQSAAIAEGLAAIRGDLS